jgi:glycosyltransferase involved in cell wall biosynthesis
VKVAMVVPGGVDRTGTERVIPCLLAAVERIARVHELHVFALTQERRPGRWTLRGAQVHNAGWRPVRVTAMAQLRAEHRRGPFDVLHGVWAGCGTVAGLAGRLFGRPVLLHLPGGCVAAVPEVGWGLCLSRAGRATLRLAAATADRVTVPSERMREMAAERGIQAERLTYGVALDAWPPLPPRRRAPAAAARLLFAASLNVVKDPVTVVRAAARLREMGVDFRLDVLGADLRGGEIQRLASALGLDRIVHFHGVVPHAELRPWMERADLLLLASRHEGDPMVALEAAVAGVPAVGTPVGHLPQWAPDAAAVVPFADPDALAHAAAALLADEERRLRMAAAAQRHALEHDADHAAARILRIYDELCEGSTR